MGTALDDASLFHDHDAVRVLDRGEPVGNHEAGASVHQGVHTALDQDFRSGIDRGCRLVENQGRGICNCGTGYGNQLSLTLAEVGSVVAKDRVIAVGKPADEAIGICQLSCTYALFVCGIELAVADVLHDGSREEVSVLKDNAQTAPEVGLFDLVDVDFIEADLAVLDVIEAVDEIDYRCLSRSGASYEGKLLAGVRIHLDVVQDHLLRVVAEVHSVEGYRAFELSVGHGAVGLMRMLPGPDVGVLICFGDCAVFCNLSPDKFHVAVVLFGFLVHHLEDALCSGAGHDYAGELLADLRNRHGEALVQRHEGHQRAQSQAEEAVRADMQGDDCAHDGNQNIADVSEVSVDRHDDVHNRVGILGAFAKLVVELLEFLGALVLVAEDLDDLLALHHLLDVAVDGSEVPLPFNEVLAGDRAELGSHLDADEDHEHGKDRERHVEDQHAHEGGDQSDRGAEKLRDALADDLPEGIDIVGVDAHDIAARVGIEILERKALHLVEELYAEFFQRSLADGNHDAVHSVVAQKSAEKHACKSKKSFCERGEVRVCLADQGQDVHVDQALGEECHRKRGKRSHSNAEHDCKECELVVLEDIFHDADDGLESSLLGLDHHASGRALGSLRFLEVFVVLAHFNPPQFIFSSKSPLPCIWTSQISL